MGYKRGFNSDATYSIDYNVKKESNERKNKSKMQSKFLFVFAVVAILSVVYFGQCKGMNIFKGISKKFYSFQCKLFKI